MKRISVNRREGRFCGSRVSMCCRGMWYRFLRGRPEEITGTPRNSREILRPFLRDLGKDFSRSMLCSQEFTASNGEVVTETSQGHKIFAAPPCKLVEIFLFLGRLAAYLEQSSAAERTFLCSVPLHALLLSDPWRCA